jgi:aspartate kinase
MTSFVVAKFGGTSVADYDAMNRSADVVLADPNTRLVVLCLRRRDEPAGFSV